MIKLNAGDAEFETPDAGLRCPYAEELLAIGDVRLLDITGDHPVADPARAARHAAARRPA